MTQHLIKACLLLLLGTSPPAAAAPKLSVQVRDAIGVESSGTSKEWEMHSTPSYSISNGTLTAKFNRLLNGSSTFDQKAMSVGIEGNKLHLYYCIRTRSLRPSEITASESNEFVLEYKISGLKNGKYEVSASDQCQVPIKDVHQVRLRPRP